MRLLTILILIFAVAAPICAIVMPFPAGNADDGYSSPIWFPCTTSCLRATHRRAGSTAASILIIDHLRESNV
jgi:hypothetical protein